jgi:hypothetical protein
MCPVSEVSSDACLTRQRLLLRKLHVFHYNSLLHIVLCTENSGSPLVMARTRRMDGSYITEN